MLSQDVRDIMEEGYMLWQGTHTPFIGRTKREDLCDVLRCGASEGFMGFIKVQQVVRAYLDGWHVIGTFRAEPHETGVQNWGDSIQTMKSRE